MTDDLIQRLENWLRHLELAPLFAADVRRFW